MTQEVAGPPNQLLVNLSADIDCAMSAATLGFSRQHKPKDPITPRFGCFENHAALLTEQGSVRPNAVEENGPPGFKVVCIVTIHRALPSRVAHVYANRLADAEVGFRLGASRFASFLLRGAALIASLSFSILRWRANSARRNVLAFI